MGGMFSTRDLKTHDVMIYVNGNSAWSEFRWDFHATLRKDGSPVTTYDVETQVYRKEDGTWRFVHLYYSGIPRIPTPRPVKSEAAIRDQH
jgi:ketosteroid isomerase-like protein